MRQKNTVLLSLLGSLWLLASPTAHAVYTVIDDDLYPTSMLEARAKLFAPVSEPDHFSISFRKSQSALGASGFAALNAILPNLRNGTIRIVGRVDATPYSIEKQGSLARNRAINIRDFLVNAGIPLSNITIVADNNPNPQSNGSLYPSDIYVTRSQARGQQLNPRDSLDANEELVSSSRPYATTTSATNLVSQPTSNNSGNAQLVQYINQAVRSGQMTPDVAVQLLRAIVLGGTTSSSQTGQPSSPMPAPTTQWLLDKKLTLKDNIDAWAKSSGWNPTVWEASAFFEVTNTTTIEGGFPDVLRKVADSTGLNICAKKREKFVRVTNANVACN